MRYRVNDDEIFDTINEALDYCTDPDYHWDDDYFETWVNDNWGYIIIDGDRYSAYEILRMADNTCGLKRQYCEQENDYDREEAYGELIDADYDDEVYYHGSTIRVLEDEYDKNDEVIPSEPVKKKTIADVRKFIEEQKALKALAAEEEKKSEEDITAMFQVIS